MNTAALQRVFRRIVRCSRFSMFLLISGDYDILSVIQAAFYASVNLRRLFRMYNNPRKGRESSMPEHMAERLSMLSGDQRALSHYPEKAVSGKMKIMVSACLLGENCKYNGGNNRNRGLLNLLSGHEIIPICPEVLGGLPVPRIPAEIVNGTVINRENISVDELFRQGAKKALEIAKKEKPDLIILQSRSPSCGAKEIYDGTFSGKLIPGQGVFAELASCSGFHVMDVEDAIANRLEELEPDLNTEVYKS